MHADKMNWHLNGVPAKMRYKCSYSKEKGICRSTTMIPAEEAHSVSNTSIDFFFYNNFPQKGFLLIITSFLLFWITVLCQA